jgi:hypothetical protein
MMLNLNLSKRLHCKSYRISPIFWVLFFIITMLLGLSDPVFALDQDENDSDRQERHFIHFKYGPEHAKSFAGEGLYASPDNPEQTSSPHAPSAEKIKAGQAKAMTVLNTMKGQKIGVAETLKVYAATEDAGFHAIHGLLGDDGINAAASQQLGMGRKAFHDEVLDVMAIAIQKKTKGLGINDFGSGADPSKINAKGDIDFTLYAKNTGLDAQWLVDQYNKTFRDLAQKKYGVNLTPGQMDIVAHRYDATIPDWRARETLADFEVKLRTGTTLLKNNPEAYFLEGAYLQQIMGRSTAAGKKTFTWLVPDKTEKTGIRKMNINAAQVPQFFYVPKVRKGLGFGGAVGNYHFHHAHSTDFEAQSKYILRSLDNGPGLLSTGKRGDYQDIGEKDTYLNEAEDSSGRQERRQIVDNIYDAPQMRLSKGLRDEIFEVYEICRKARIAKDKKITLSDPQQFKGLIDYHKKISLTKIDDATALKLAKQTFKSTSEMVLTANVIRTIKPRARDWLRPHTLKKRISYVDENGNIISVKATKADLKRLQFAAFREIHDAVQILQQDKKSHVLEQLKKQNPILKNDIEIVENIIRKKREMMLAPKDKTPEAAMTIRQKAAQSVIDSWKQMGNHASDSSLWSRTMKSAGNAWATGQALESYVYSNLTHAVIYSGGKKYGPALEQLRIVTEDTNKNIISPMWMTRISRANSVVHVLTLYAQEGHFSERVLKEMVIEGISHFPLIGMPIDIYRGTISGLLKYDGSISGLIKTGLGSSVGQIVMSQFIPGYGPVILVLNTTKGVVNLGGTILFTPLKNQRVKLAYQGYLDPVEINPKSVLYQQFLKQTGTEGIQNAIAWWMDSTGKKERIYSPRPSVLHPIDPGMKMSVEERRRAVLAYFQPQILGLFKQRFGGGAEVKEMPTTYISIENEFLPKIMYKHVHSWWEGKGLFSAYDSLTVKRMMDEYYSKEMKATLVQMLISDYIAGKGELIKQENEWSTSLNNLYSVAAGYANEGARIYTENYPQIRTAHKNAALQQLGLEQEEADHINPRIELVSSPKVLLAKDNQGSPTTIIEKLQIRAKVVASDTPEHPAPFSLRFQLKTGSINKNIQNKETFKFKLEPKNVPEQITLTALAYDANNKLLLEHDITIPIINKETTTDFDGGNDLEEVFYNLEELAKKAEESATGCVERSKHARSAFAKAKIEYNALMAKKRRVEDNFKKATQIIREIDRHTQDAKQAGKKADDHANRLGQNKESALQLSQQVCQSIHIIKENPSLRTRILSSNARKRRELQELFSKGQTDLFAYQVGTRTIQTKTDTIIQRQGDLAHLLSTETEELDQGLILDLIIDADISGTDAQDHLDTIGDLLVDAEKDYENGTLFIKNVQSKRKQKKLHYRLDKLMDRIRTAQTTAQNANEPFSEQVGQLNKQLEINRPQFDALNTQIVKFHKKTTQITSARKELSQKAEKLFAAQPHRNDDLAAIDTAILDADICSESVQTTASEQADNKCNKLSSALNRAYQKKDGTTYLELLNQYKNCLGYTQAQNVYNNLIQENTRCNQISQQLENARKRGDTKTYGNLLNQFRGCVHYNDALSLYNDMRRSDQRCNQIAGELNQAQKNGDIRAYGNLLSRFKGCNYYNQALNVYNSMVQNANNQRCNQLLNQLNQAQRQKDVRAYGNLLNQSRDCSFYNQAVNVYNGMKNNQNMQAMNNFMGGLMQIMDQRNNPNDNRPSVPPRNSQPPKPPSRPNTPPSSTTQTGNGGMSQADCEKKFCPVCVGPSNTIDLIGVSMNRQCTDCREKYRKKIQDCVKGGVSANRRDNSLSQFKKYQVIKCVITIKNDKGKIIGYKTFYEFSGPSRARPKKAKCSAVWTGTWEECLNRARYYNKKYDTKHSVMP